MLAAVGPMAALGGAWAIGLDGWFNDFHVYYLAGALVARGDSPYDAAAMTALGRAQGLDFVVGGGYSYPPPFAVAMAALAALPFAAAAALFTAVSVASFALVIGWWVARVVDRPSRRRLLALAAGFYPPVAGSVFAGQANLIVVALLGFGLAPFLPAGSPAGAAPPAGFRRSLGAGVAIGFAGIVKVAPLALAAPLALIGLRRRPAAVALGGLVAGAAAALVLAGAIAPSASAGAAGLGGLLAPDPFWTNQSINGALSRLFLDGDRTTALLPADPSALIAGMTALLAAATAVVLVRVLVGPDRPTRRGVAVALALAIVAAAVGAPKNSFWNHAPVLLAVALALGAGGLTATGGRRILVGVWAGATALQAVLDRWLDQPAPAHSAALTVLSDSATIALLALWLALASLALSIAEPAVRREVDGA
ncbi:MAG TPA: glycosyltransferase 87 family protein [Candidatus Limnocylindrales bacterium]|nr:glycosyltransferase 87 family protein [Candidatus Limnocylindrales bacterium]